MTDLEQPVAPPLPRRCTFSAPARCTYSTPDGKWASREWHTRDDKGEPFGEKWAYEHLVLGQHDTPQPTRHEKER